MPWVNEEDCIGCGICVDDCPAETIFIENGVAEIDMGKCIHCGICHSSCPEGAIRHDSEKIPDEVAANIKMTKEFMDACAEYLGDLEEKDKCLKRMIKHFNKEKIVAEKTIEELKNVDH